MHKLILPEDLDNLVDKDIDRWNAVMDYLEWWANNKRFGGQHFSIAPTTPIAGTQVSDGEVGTEQTALYIMTATELAAAIAAEQHFYDESVLHEALDWASSLLVRDGTEGFGTLSGVVTGTIESGALETTIQVLGGDVTPTKAIIVPIRPVLSLGVAGATFATDPVKLYPFDLSSAGFKILAAAGEALGASFSFSVYWTVWTAVRP